jgi:hypothetical protein
MANLRACKRAGFRVPPADERSTVASRQCGAQAVKNNRAAQQGRPYAHAVTGHNLILRDVSPPIADAPPSRVRVSAALFAPPATRITRQCKRNNTNRGEYANGKNHPKPVVVHRHLPVSTNTIGPSGGQPEQTSYARPAGSGAGSEESGNGHKPPPARRDAQECGNLQKVPRRRGAARKDKLLESPNFLCGSAMFHLAAGQPCFMEWQNRETARLEIEPEET